MSPRTERRLLADATSSESEKSHVCRLGLRKQPTASAKIQNGHRMYLAVGLHLGSALAAALVSAGTASIFAEKSAMPKLSKHMRSVTFFYKQIASKEVVGRLRGLSNCLLRT